MGSGVPWPPPRTLCAKGWWEGTGKHVCFTRTLGHGRVLGPPEENQREVCDQVYNLVTMQPLAKGQSFRVAGAE